MLKKSLGSLSQICPSKHVITFTSNYFKFQRKFFTEVTAKNQQVLFFFCSLNIPQSFNTLRE